MAEQQLKQYYNYLYPFATLTNWLTRNKTSNLLQRELSFEYQGSVVERYVTFKDAQDMKDRMIDRQKRTPLKVDAGAIWDRKPEKESTAKPVERQFIFDFDMNDYDDVRTCCVGKKVCLKCWRLLVIAVQIIEKCLAQDFDFHQLMYVFSGGRGLHIWVCDKKAREMKDSLRKAVVDYLELVTGNEKATSLLSDHVISKLDDNSIWKTKKELTNKDRNQIKDYYIKNYTHAHVERSLHILSKYFDRVMEEQQVFTINEDRQFKNQKCIDLMLKIIAHRSEKLRDKVQEMWNRMRGRDAISMLHEMEQEIIRFETKYQTIQDYAKGKRSEEKVYRLTFIMEQIMLSFLYPRMDYNVSTMQNHLLKLPFSVHPSTKRISIPLFKRQIQNFDPERCVTIDDLLRQFNDHEKDRRPDQNISKDTVQYNQTQAMKSLLRQPVQALRQFTQQLN